MDSGASPHRCSHHPLHSGAHNLLKTTHLLIFSLRIVSEKGGRSKLVLSDCLRLEDVMLTPQESYDSVMVKSDKHKVSVN